MNAKMKRRMIAVGGVIVIVIILLLAFAAGGNNAKIVSVSDAASGSYANSKVQVSGLVVTNSYSVDKDGTLVFSIADQNDTAQATTLRVSYDKGVSATLGNGVTAICTGRIGEDGTLKCTELVTKCPSKYENSSDSLTVAELQSYSLDSMAGKTVKVAGTVSQLSDATAKVRMVLNSASSDSAGTASLNVIYSGALSADVKDGITVIATGSLEKDGSFLASEIALER